MANLLDQASIVLTPTAYDNGKVLCAKPSEAPYGDFDFSRNSAATRVNAQGLVENVQILSSNLVQNGDFSEEGAEEVSNGNFSQEGAELVTNGNFDTDLSGWIGQVGRGSYAWDNGKAKITNNEISSYPNLSQVIPTTAGKLYKINAKVEIGTATLAEVRAYSGGILGSQQINTDGEIEFYVTAVGGSFTLLLYLFETGNTGNYCYYDNVSVREVGQDWTLGTGWSIGEDKAVATNVNGTFLAQNSILTSGKTYKITYTVQDYVSGNVRFRSNLVNGSTNSGNGTYTDYIVSGGTQFALQGLNTFNGSITNISVKEVGQNWEILNDVTSFSFENGIANIQGTANSANNGIKQASISAVIGKTYKISATLRSNDGGLYRFRLLDGSYFDLGSGNSTEFETITSYHTATSTAFTIFATSWYTSGTSNFDISNISILEISTDTNLPRINYEGFSYQDALGSELIDYSTLTSSSSSWSLVGGLWVFDDTANGYLTTPNISVVVGDVFDVVVDVTIASGNANFRYTSGNAQTILFDYTDFVDGVNEFQATVTGVDGVLQRLFAPASLTDNPFTLKKISIKKINGQEVVPNSGCGSWLWEPQTTQLLPYSEDFSQSSWSKGSDISIESGYLAPDGNNTAYKVTKTGGGAPYLTRNQSLITTTTRSIYARSISGTGTATLLSHNSNTNNVFTLTEQWQRFELNNTASSSGLSTFYAADFRGSGTLTEYLIWGANATNDQDYATSYIPTSGSSVTRNQDVCNNGGSLATINSTEGVLYAEIAALANDGTVRYFGLNDGSNNNRAIFLFDGSANRVRAIVSSGGTKYVDFNYTVTDLTEFHKIALKYKQNDFALWIDGTERNTDTSGLTPVGLDNLEFDLSSGGAFYGKTKALAVWKEALSDQELADLTYPTPTDPTFSLDFDTIAEQFTFTRGSEATYVDAQGLIQSTNEIGEELVVNGGFEDGSTGWSLGNWTAQNNTATINGQSGILSQASPPLVSGKKYKWTFEITEYNSGSVKLYSGGGADAATYENSVGIHTQYFVANGTGKYFYSNSFNGSVTNVSVKEYTTATNTPRLDYSTGAEAFLLEPQSTNLITYSSDYSQSYWTKQTGITATYNTTETLSPDGTYNATKFVGNGTTGVYKASISVSGVVSRSVYLKSVTGTTTATFKEPNTNVPSPITLTITNEWQRFEMIGDNGSSFQGLQIDDITSDGVYMWGSQLEQQDYATSYIPSNGSQTTRNQETCINATPEINSEEGVLYFEGAALFSRSNAQISLSDGTNDNGVKLRFDLTDNRFTGFIKGNGGTTASKTVISSPQTNNNKIALVWNATNLIIWVNGVEEGLIATNDLPIGLDTLNFASNTGLLPFYGNTKNLQVYPKALSDAELIKLTT